VTIAEPCVQSRQSLDLSLDINYIDIVKYCQYCFGFEMTSELWAKHISKLDEKNR